MEEQKFLEKEVNHLEKQLENIKDEPKSGFDKSKLFLPISILIAAVLISSSLLYTRGDLKGYG